MKKAAIFLLVFLFVLPAQGIQAAENNFAFDPASGTISRYTGSDSAVVIPADIGGIPVRAIGAGAFDQNRILTRVVIPEGVTHINYNAFYFCENLAEVVLPQTLEAIDSYAFFNCTALKALRFPERLAYVGGSAFAGCSQLGDITFLGECPMISAAAFEGGPAGRQVTVPQEESAPYETALGQAVLAGGSVMRLDHTAPESAFAFEGGHITGYTGSTAYVVVPDALGGMPVAGIAERAFFANPWLRRITLPAGVKSIGESAFFGTKLADVSLPEGLESIGKAAFGGVPLERISLPESLKNLGEGAFASAAFKEVRLPSQITTIPKEAFLRCWGLETAYFPSGLMEIGKRAFFDCDRMGYLVFAGATPPAIAPDAFSECDKIADIDIATTGTRQDAQAFQDAFLAAGLPQGSFSVWRADPANLPSYDTNAKSSINEDTGLITSYAGPQKDVAMFWTHWNAAGTQTLDVKGVADGLFEGSDITSFYVPHSNQFESIGKRAFADSALTSIHLFDSVKTIGDEAFAGCKDLSAITLPAGISLGHGVFNGCDALSRLVIPADALIAGDLGLPPEKLYITASATDEQRQAIQSALNIPWYLTLPREGEALAFARMPDSFVPGEAQDFEFDPQTGTLTKYVGSQPTVVIPREIGGVAVKAIGELAFSNLTVLSVLEGSADNTSLSQVVIPETITQIADSAFLNCKTLTRVECFGPVERVGIRAFEQCDMLEEIIFHNGVKALDLYAFNLCKSLKKAELGSAIQALPEGVFFGCGFEGNLVLSIPVIGNSAFRNCAQVTALHILPSVQDIAEGAFLGMAGLKEVYFESGNPQVLGDYRFQFDEQAGSVNICLPESATDEQLQAFITKMDQNRLPGKDMVIRKNCPVGHL